jgi:hypothetical protein
VLVFQKWNKILLKKSEQEWNNQPRFSRTFFWELVHGFPKVDSEVTIAGFWLVSSTKAPAVSRKEGLDIFLLIIFRVCNNWMVGRFLKLLF